MKSTRIPALAAVCMLLGSLLVYPAAADTPVIRDLAVEPSEQGPILHVRSTGTLETVHYSPQPGVWVVEMPEATWERGSQVVAAPELGVERAELSAVEEFGRRLSRLTVWLTEPAQLALTTTADGLDLSFTPAGDAAPAPEEEPAALPPVVASEEPAADAAPVPPPAERTLAGAASLLAVEPIRTGAELRIELSADGPLRCQTFVLANPARLVVDLDGVVNRVKRHLFAVHSDLVRQVRVAQNRTDPAPVTRVVVDLEGAASHRLITSDRGATLIIGPSDPPIAMSGGDLTATAAADGSITVTQATPPAPEPDPVIARYEPRPAPAAQAAPVPQAVPSDTFRLPEPQPAAVTSEAVPEPAPRSPFVADADQLIERAPAAQVLDAGTREQEFEPTEVATQEQQFTGEPISLTLKDADIKDVLRTFSALTQLNIVLDPGVSGSVTVELRDVPWDQALDLILRINGLDYVLENNVLRVAPISKLAAEKAQQANFEKQQEDAKPLKTVVKPLSYAKASYVKDLIGTESYLLSNRGSVVMDERTNKLIIRDVVDRVEGILRLIDTLDQPTPQVVIEGRIVETTRDFSRELGVNWGFSSVMDAAHGNDTGLEFPNSIEIGGNVNLPGSSQNGTVSFAFADILNTFNLDFLLTAAESDGLARIVSTPRVTTQNLKTAQIRSGLQIPVQTVANNTVTVQYVDATLRLEVTPQITAEGTVNLELDIRKQEPQQAFQIPGATTANVPIFTRDATTELLVRDGGTTVIAGIYQINEQNSEDRIPALHKIPILGNLFKTTLKTRRHDELLIFITPRIVKY